MRSYLVKTLIVEHSHERSISWRSVRIRNLQLPLLLLSRCQTVTEGLPRQIQTFVWHRTTDGMLVHVTLAVLYPGISDKYAVLLIGELTINQGSIPLDATTF